MGNHSSSLIQLHEAIRRDNRKAVQYFLKTTQQDINCKVNGQTALFLAVVSQKPDVVDILLTVPSIKLNAVCNLQRQDGVQFEWSTIHEVCRQGSTQLLETLIEKGADVNLLAHHRMSPLHIAAWHGRKEAVQLLVNHGCDVNQTDRFQESALVIPICHGDVEIVSTLLNAGCKLSGRSWGNTRKIRGKNEDDFRETLYGRHGPYTLLLLAIKYSWLHIACILLQHGFNPCKYQIHDILKNIKSNIGSIDQEAQTLIHCFLDAGYRFHAKDHCLLEDLICEENHGYNEGLIKKLLDKSCQPKSLLELSRTAIRSHLRVVHGQRSIVHAVKELYLPRSLTAYLCLEEYDHVIKETGSGVDFNDDVRSPLYFAMPRKRKQFEAHAYFNLSVAACFCGR